MNVHQEDLHTDPPVGGAQLEESGGCWVGRQKERNVLSGPENRFTKRTSEGEPNKEVAPRALAAKGKNSSKAQHFSLECWLTAPLDSGVDAGLCQ